MGPLCQVDVAAFFSRSPHTPPSLRNVPFHSPPLMSQRQGRCGLDPLCSRAGAEGQDPPPSSDSPEQNPQSAKYAAALSDEPDVVGPFYFYSETRLRSRTSFTCFRRCRALQPVKSLLSCASGRWACRTLFWPTTSRVRSSRRGSPPK
jgi:hypothetical protein